MSYHHNSRWRNFTQYTQANRRSRPSRLVMCITRPRAVPWIRRAQLGQLGSHNKVILEPPGDIADGGPGCQLHQAPLGVGWLVRVEPEACLPVALGTRSVQQPSSTGQNEVTPVVSIGPCQNNKVWPVQPPLPVCERYSCSVSKHS